jgi:hypothetical protein
MNRCVLVDTGTELVWMQQKLLWWRLGHVQISVVREQGRDQNVYIKAKKTPYLLF